MRPSKLGRRGPKLGAPPSTEVAEWGHHHFRKQFANVYTNELPPLTNTKKAAGNCRKICDVYGEDAVTERVCQKWFSRFRSENFFGSRCTSHWPPTEIDSDKVKEMVDTNPRYTTRQTADILKISKSSVENHLHQLGYVSRLDVWVPHQLSQANLIQRISICDSLWKREENELFALDLVRLEGSCLLRASSHEQDHQFGCVL
ncbi:hypothetical protein AAG570_005164 [Ranatra chinensis]|uniref:Mos1 transposase HTH domain-containing protein n=1 Tax=Ranatra chinensis TaxID=642074 RepID=A0ABD0XZM6_9HEMI